MAAILEVAKTLSYSRAVRVQARLFAEDIIAVAGVIPAQAAVRRVGIL
jgi:hypothetical protein